MEVCWTRPIPVSPRVKMYLRVPISCLNFPLLVSHRRLAKPRSRPLRSAQDPYSVHLIAVVVAPGETVLEGLEREAREAKKGLWADPAPIPPWEWKKK